MNGGGEGGGVKIRNLYYMGSDFTILFTKFPAKTPTWRYAEEN